MATWAEIRQEALERDSVVVRLADVPHPRDAGAVSAVGMPRGQSEDWRFPPDDLCRGVHVQRFGTLWLVHVDKVHPDCSLIGHARMDAPALYVGAGAGIGLLAGLALGNATAGVIIGSVLAGATLPRGGE